MTDSASQTTTPDTLPRLDRPLDFVRDKVWWKATYACCVRFAPRCILPAGLLAAANIGLILGLTTVNKHLGDLTPTMEGDHAFAIFGTLLTALGTAAVSMIVLFVSLWIWLDKFHVFTHAYYFDGTTAGDKEFDAADKHYKEHKSFYFVFWLIASVYLALPTIFMIMFIACKVLMRPEFAVAKELMAVAAPDIGRINLICDAGASLFFYVVMAYSFVALVFSSIQTEAPGKLAAKAMTQSIIHIWPVIVCSLLFTLFDVGVMVPFGIASWAVPAAHLDENVWFVVLSQLWFGATSCVLWPLSAAPFCMITSNARST